MLSSSTNKHHPPLSVYLIIPTSILLLISLPIDLMHACMLLPAWFPTPLPFPHLPFKPHTRANNPIILWLASFFTGTAATDMQDRMCPIYQYTHLGSSWEVWCRPCFSGVCNACIALKGVWTALHGRLACGQVYVGLLHYISRKLDQLVGGMQCIHACLSLLLLCMLCYLWSLKASVRKHCPSLSTLAPLLKVVSLSGPFSPVIFVI